MFLAHVGQCNVDVPGLTAGLQAQLDRKIFAVLTAVQVDIIDYLRSYTTEQRPPVHKGHRQADVTRPAHPGHWADVTGALRDGYHADVLRGDDGQWMLNIWNDAVNDHGQLIGPFLEARDGFFVLSGIMADDGPVQQAVRAAFERFDGDMTMQVAAGVLQVGYTP